MVQPVGWEKMNPVQLALFNARFQLAFLHGYVLGIDKPILAEQNLEIIGLIDKAEEWLTEHDYKDNSPECSE